MANSSGNPDYLLFPVGPMQQLRALASGMSASISPMPPHMNTWCRISHYLICDWVQMSCHMNIEHLKLKSVEVSIEGISFYSERIFSKSATLPLVLTQLKKVILIKFKTTLYTHILYVNLLPLCSAVYCSEHILFEAFQ